MHGPTKLGHPRARQRQGYDHPALRVMAEFKALPPESILTELLDYNPVTGEFIWKQNRGRMAKAGDKAGTIYSGYLRIRVGSSQYFAHRLAWLIWHGKDPGEYCIDHINGNKLDNRICNLRLCTHAENMRNRKINTNSSSGLKGVSFDKSKNRWRAVIKFQNKSITIGRFDTPELAHLAYCKAAAELHGEFARAA